MNKSVFRTAAAATVTLLALIISACTPTQTAKQAFGPPATTAEITQHLSGKSSSTSFGGAYYAENGDYKSFYYLPETRSEAPEVCTGSWRAHAAKLKVKETCKYVSGGKTVSGDPKTTGYTVYINELGGFRLDEQREDPSTGKWELRKPLKGFPQEASFIKMQKKIESGQKVMTEAEMMVIGVPLSIAYCALVGPMCLLM